MIDLVVKHILLFLSLTICTYWSSNTFTLILHLLCLVKLEKLLYFRHLEIVIANSPDQPIEMLFELKILTSDDNALERDWAHIG